MMMKLCRRYVLFDPYGLSGGGTRTRKPQYYTLSSLEPGFALENPVYKHIKLCSASPKPPAAQPYHPDTHQHPS